MKHCTSHFVCGILIIATLIHLFICSLIEHASFPEGQVCTVLGRPLYEVLSEHTNNNVCEKPANQQKRCANSQHTNDNWRKQSGQQVYHFRVRAVHLAPINILQGFQHAVSDYGRNLAPPHAVPIKHPHHRPAIVSVQL